MLSVKKKELSRADKDEKIEAARQFHKKILQDYDIEPKAFNVKMAFTNKGQKIVGIFENEFKKPNGFFIELVDSNLDPIDPKRKIHKLAPRSNFADVYELLPYGSYAVPVEDLELVVPASLEHINISAEDPGKIYDDHFSKMTIKDLAAILWQSPVSDKRWLNDLIEKTKTEQAIGV